MAKRTTTKRRATPAKKSGKKSARKPAPKRSRKAAAGAGSGPFKPGPDSRRGRGPKKGAPNAGRPPREHIEWCRTVISDPKAEKAVVAVLRNAKHPLFANLWGKVAGRAYGLPKSAAVTFPIDVRDLTDAQLERVAAGEDPLAVIADARERQSR